MNAHDKISPVVLYGVLLAVCGSLLSFQLYAIGAPSAYLAPSVICLATAVTRFRWGVYLVPVTTLGALSLSIVWGTSPSSNLERWLLATVTFSVIGLSLRLQGMTSPVAAKVSRKRVIHGPMDFRAVQQAMPSHLASLALAWLAWWAAGYLISDFARATSDADIFFDYQGWVRRSYRLVPWAYCGIKLVVLLSALLALAHGILSYLDCRNRDGLLPAIRLRAELWKWNGSEQRRIGKAVSRQHRSGLFLRR